jgi:hypothetical protein
MGWPESLDFRRLWVLSIQLSLCTMPWDDGLDRNSPAYGIARTPPIGSAAWQAPVQANHLRRSGVNVSDASRNRDRDNRTTSDQNRTTALSTD